MPETPDFPRQFARTRRFSLGVPGQFTVSADGRRVLFLRTRGGADPVSRLWLHEDGAERLLVDPQESYASVASYAADAETRFIACAVGGALWTVRTDEAKPSLVSTAGPVVDPRPSPDGRSVAYVTGGALRVVELDGGADRALAEPEGPDVSYGLGDHLRSRGHWWAPDGSALLVARADVARVQRWYLADPNDPAAPPRVIRYPSVGTANADVSLFVLTLDGRRRTEVRWDRSAFEYLPVVSWDAHGPLIAVQSRDQRTLRTLAVDPATGATRLLHEQRDPVWVELISGTPCRTAAGSLVVTRDDSGADTRRLVVDGGTVTPAGLHVRAVLGTDGESVLFTGGDEPTETHVWRWTPGHGCTRLSDGPGMHTAVAAGGTTVLISGDTATVLSVLADGQPPSSIASFAETPVVTPRPAFLRLGERALRSCLYLPSWHHTGTRLPVLLDPYGGQHVQKATRAQGWPACVSQWFAEQGFAVLVTDGRGSPGRGPAWEKEIRGDILTHALQDQVDALHAAAVRYPDLDLDRVAIRGWSFGGFLATGAVLRRPDVFHAAVAGAPSLDQRLYDAHWKERYLGHPDEEPANYDRCTLVGEAASLRRPLLLIHGLADDNVLPAHTLRFSAALVEAGRLHQLVLLPATGHRAIQEPVLHAQLDFLRGVLG